MEPNPLLALKPGFQENAVGDIEIAWLEQSGNEDLEGFSRLVEKYQGAVYNLCYRMLGDHYEAEDAAQETFLRAYRSISRYDRERSFSTWLLSIAAHYCIDQIRRRRMSLVPLDGLPYKEFMDIIPNPEASLVLNEDQQQVRTLLNELTPIDRAAVVMRYWFDFTYEEIGEALNLTLSAVKSRLHRARRELAQTWIEKGNQTQITGRTSHESQALLKIAFFRRTIE